MDSIATQIETAIVLLQKNLLLVLLLVGSLYLIHFFNWLCGYRLNYLGIYPRSILGLPGIIFSPFLHGNFNHLFFNSIPLFILMSFVLLNGLPTFFCVTTIIVVLGGLGTWIFGRRALHVGASGLIMGYWSYLLLQAYQNPSVISVALAVVCLYYFGGLIFNLFPVSLKASWEAHVFGFLAGLVAAFVCQMPAVAPYLSAL